MDLLLAALDRADEHLGLRDRRQLHERFAAQRRVGRELEFEQLDLAAEEGVGLDGRRGAERPGHLGRADELRIDGQAQPQIVGDERKLPGVFGVAHAGDGVPRADLLRDQAAQEVQLVLRRHGDDQIRLVHARLDLRGVGRAVALDAQNVEILDCPLQRRPAAVDNGDLMPLARELLGQRAADLSVAHDHDPHGLNSFCLIILKIIPRPPLFCNRPR